MRRGDLHTSVLVALLTVGMVSTASALTDPSRENESGLKALNEGKYEEAINHLTAARQAMPSNQTIRTNLAIACNNYALALARESNWDEALRYFDEALKWSPTESSGQIRDNRHGMLVQRAQQYVDQRRYAEAERELREVLQENAQYADALILLGIVEYDTQRLAQAKTHWLQAQQLRPGDAAVAEWLSRVEQEAPIEQQLKKMPQFYFEIRYQPGVVGQEEFVLRDLLTTMRREVGGDFGYYPPQKVVVILYSPGDFRSLRQSTPDWLAGRFDGKIRIPMQSFQDPQFQNTLWHEYTHAVVADLSLNRCPTWVNEGLAEFEGARRAPADLSLLRQALQHNPPLLIPLAELSQAFDWNATADRVNLAYQQAHSLVGYLIERYGWWKIKQLLADFKADKPLEQVLKERLYLTVPQLERHWLEYLQQHPSQGVG